MHSEKTREQYKVVYNIRAFKNICIYLIFVNRENYKFDVRMYVMLWKAYVLNLKPNILHTTFECSLFCAV